MFTHNFKIDLQIILQRIKSKDNFVFSKYADGEYKIGSSQHCVCVDGWNFTPKENSIITDDLVLSLKHDENNYLYGISCPCCDPNGYKWYLTQLKQNISRYTYANIFVNSNYPDTKEFLTELEEEIILIANHKANLDKLNVLEHLTVSDNVIEDYSRDHARIIHKFINLSRDYNDKLFIFSCGPLSNILISNMYNTNPNNRYIDMGSSLDEIIFENKKTRTYQIPNSPTSHKVCKFK